MNVVSGRVCAHIGKTEPEEPPEDGDRDDTALQTQDLKFEPWQSEAELATSRSPRFHTILILFL